MQGFDLAQTFYLDAQAVQNADTVFLTSVQLYFNRKPEQYKTASGIASPGASVYIAATKEDGSPDLSTTFHQFGARVEYANINVSTTAETSTTFTFRQPVPVATNRSFAIMVKFDGSDTGFELWYNKAGKTNIGTAAITQVSSGKVDGSLYKITNGNQLTPERDTDLSFKVSVARFTSTNTTFKTKNRPYEVLKVYSFNGSFIGGEDVYQVRAAATGTVNINETTTTITGTGTSFSSIVSAGDRFVLTDGTPGNTDIRTVVSVANNTQMEINLSPSFTAASGSYYRTVTGKMCVADEITDHLVIEDSTANSSIYLTTNQTIYGVDSSASANVEIIKSYSVNSVIPSYKVITPAGTLVNTSITFANTSFGVDAANAIDCVIGARREINEYPAMVSSASIEKTAGVPFNSATASVTMRTNNPYTSPFVREENLDTFIEQYDINNDVTNESLGRGNAKTRYISQTVNLSKGQVAEDLKVYIRAYKPAGTNVKVYAKFKNFNDPETMSVKQWTELNMEDGTDQISNETTSSDIVELSYKIPTYFVGALANGTFTTSASAVVVGSSGTVNSNIVVGDLVRVYSPLFDMTYFIDVVTASNTSTFTVSTAVSNSSVIGSGFLVEKVTRKNSTFLDVQNYNIATYYNNTLGLYEGFDSFQLKVILLSEDGVSVPFVNDLRAIAVSA